MSYYDPLLGQLVMGDPNKANVNSDGDIELATEGTGIIFTDETDESKKKQYLKDGKMKLEDVE